MHPRKVRGGVRLSDREGKLPGHWATQRWLRLLEAAAPSGNLSEAMEYAKAGQIRRLGLDPGLVAGSVQGRLRAAYAVRIEIGKIDESAWGRVVNSMSEQALYAAKLLSGELPPTIEDAFAPFGLHLFPTGAEMRPTCTCVRGKRDPGAWCKHALCAALLVADRLATDPFLIFGLRGLASEELIERMRQRRQLSAGGGEATPVYAPSLSAEGAAEDPRRFWQAGDELASLELPLTRPEASHVLLRRLGPSPFQRGFPMVGLLATCYEVISGAAARAETDTAETPTETPVEESPPPEEPKAPAVRPRRARTIGKAKAIGKARRASDSASD